METRLTDIIVPEVFLPYVIRRTTELSVLQSSGIMANVPGITIPKGGTVVNLPFWNDLNGSGDAEDLSDSAALTPGKITTGQDAAAVQFVGKAWGSNELVGAVAGSDPMRAIADQVAAYWAAQQQKRLLAVLKGIFAATGPLASTHTLDISALTGGAEIISYDAIVDAIAKLGDAGVQLTGMLVHSAVMYKLSKLKLLDTKAAGTAQSAPELDTILGRRLVVDDGAPVATGVYTTYLFGAGAIGYAEGGEPTPVETDRDSLAGTDVLINRKHMIIHPRGIKWVGTAAGVGPSLTELQTAANWSKAYPDKAIRIVRLVHKIA